MFSTPSLLLVLLASSTAFAAEISLGMLTNVADHGLGGEVVALSDRVLEFRNFTFDGQGPDVFFWADMNAEPSANGFVLQDGFPVNGCGNDNIQMAADGTQTWRVEFPTDTSLSDVSEGSIGVWCGDFAVNFGDVRLSGTDLTGLKAAADGPELECAEVEVEYASSAATKGLLAALVAAAVALV